MRDQESYSYFINLESSRKIDISPDDLKFTVDKVTNKIINEHYGCREIGIDHYKSWYDFTDQIDWFKVGKYGFLVIDGMVENEYGTVNMISLLKELQLEHQFFFKKGGLYQNVIYYWGSRHINNYPSNGDGSFNEEDVIIEDDLY